MIKLFANRRWAELKAQVQSVSAEEAYIGISAAGREAPDSIALDGLVEGPGDVLGLTIAGGFNRYRAWKLRGYATADQTSDAAMNRYIDTLRDALADLNAAVELDPTNGLAVGFLASAAADLPEEDKEAIGNLLALARDVAPSGYMALLNAQTEKWGGSHAKMWETAHRYRDRAKPGTLALIARAHFEHHLYLSAMDERPAAQAEAKQYYRQTDRLTELQSAADESFMQSTDDIHARRLADGWFARALFDAEDRARARRHLVRLGRHVDDWIWGAGSLFSAPLTWRLVRIRSGLWFG